MYILSENKKHFVQWKDVKNEAKVEVTNFFIGFQPQKSYLFIRIDIKWRINCMLHCVGGLVVYLLSIRSFVHVIN